MIIKMNTYSNFISIVIPVYCSSDCLPELLKQISIEIPTLSKEFEVILVNDSSPDNSWEVILKLSEQYTFLKGINLMMNGGQAKAILCGIEHASGDLIILMDDDLQHQPSELYKFIEAFSKYPKTDCVFAKFDKKKHKKYRNIGSKIMRKLNQQAYGFSPNISASSFCGMKSSVAKAVVSHKTLNPSIAALIYATTSQIRNVNVSHSDRFAGESNYNFKKQFRLAWDNICYVSMVPLRIVSGLGMISCFSSFMLIIEFIYKYFIGQTSIAGWTTVVILISFFGGVTLLSIGMIGEYIIRILREVRKSPRHIIRNTIGIN